MVKRLRKSVLQYIQRYLTKYAKPRREHATQFPSVSMFSAETTGPIFTKIFTQYGGISGAMKSHIHVHKALVHSVSECQSNE